MPEEKCLVVKLGAEVCDFSEDMRSVLLVGTDKIIERIAGCVEKGMADGSIPLTMTAYELAESLYQLWLGASLLAKVNKSTKPFETALAMTNRMIS